MELNGKTVNPGDPVWVMEWSTNGNATGFFGDAFIAEIRDYVVATPYWYGAHGLDDILEALSKYGGNVKICRKQDCFATKYDAAEAFEKLREAQLHRKDWK